MINAELDAHNSDVGSGPAIPGRPSPGPQRQDPGSRSSATGGGRHRRSPMPKAQPAQIPRSRPHARPDAALVSPIATDEHAAAKCHGRGRPRRPILGPKLPARSGSSPRQTTADDAPDPSESPLVRCRRAPNDVNIDVVSDVNSHINNHTGRRPGSADYGRATRIRLAPKRRPNAGETT